MKNWTSARDAFSALNDNLTYLVIRNFEGFFDSILLDNHADIDILCHKKDRHSIVRLLDAQPRLEKDDGIHYKFQVDSAFVPLDIRYIGGGYYDANWEKAMLCERILDPRGFYRMNTDHYFWSLLYHALYHKGHISEEYYTRLSGLKCELFPSSMSELETLLSAYMEDHHYRYSIARDPYLWYHFTPCCKGRIQGYACYKMRHLRMHINEFWKQRITRGK